MENEIGVDAKLLPVTNSIVESVESQTGRKVVVLADPKVAQRGRAVYHVIDSDPSRHLVSYDPSERSHLDHLVAHEMGHAMHFAEASPEEGVVPVISGKNLQNGLTQLMPEINQLLAKGHSEKSINEASRMWVRGTVSQLSDTPSDVRIEREIFEKHPDLRAAQEKSLRHQIQKLHKVLTPQVERVTPRSVWIASNAMNYVLVDAIAEQFRANTFRHPYIKDPIYHVGEELKALLTQHSDGTFAGDRRVTDAWAERLGFENWFEWRKVDELQESQKANNVVVE